MRALSPFLLMILVAACAPIARPTPAPVMLPATIPGPGTVRVDLPPAESPDDNPTMMLKVKLFDEATQGEITGIVYWWPYPVWMGYNGDDVVAFRVHGIDLALGAEADGWLAVVSPGYRPVRVQVRYRIESSRYLEMPIWMRKVKDEVDGDAL